jgi:hypothetical protein
METFTKCVDLAEGTSFQGSQVFPRIFRKAAKRGKHSRKSEKHPKT